MNRKQLSTGTWLSIGSSVITELASLCRLDWLLLDMEHGCLTEANLLQNLQVVKGDTKTIVRIGKADSALIARVLDWGASGIMLPHVSNPEQAAACVQAMNYPPKGHRGFSSSSRSFGYGTSAPSAPTTWDQPLFIAQIEDYEGIQKADSIASVDGVDILFVGPADLKLDLSVRSSITITYENALQQVCSAATNHQKQAGILVRNVADLPTLKQMGFSCVAIGSDLGFIRDGFRSIAAM